MHGECQTLFRCISKLWKNLQGKQYDFHDSIRILLFWNGNLSMHCFPNGKLITHESVLGFLGIHDILVWIRIWIRGSMPLTNGSGSGFGSCYFRHWPSRCKQKANLFLKVFGLSLLKVHLHNFSKIKVKKKSQSSRNRGFPYYFCLVIEGSGSGSIPLTNGSGSGSRSPKNIRIRWIRTRNTAMNTSHSQSMHDLTYHGSLNSNAVRQIG